ncbi:MAG: MATE family efflux transporter [Firmicutes bacterium]|nr:MATE family efflux transporter [Bacillota bacterium]
MNVLVKDREFYQRVLQIGVPIMIQNFLGQFLNMVDTIMVGRLGETEIAAVGIANQYFFFFHMVLIGICSGCGIFIAQYWGKRDTVNIKRILGLGLSSVTVIALLFIAVGLSNPRMIIAIFNKETLILELGSQYLRIILLGYLFTAITFMFQSALRSIGNTVLPMFISVVGLVCNIVLNYALIFGNLGMPAFGVQGAAIATVIARIVETVGLILAVYLGKEVIAASMKEMLDFTLAYVRDVFKTVTPVVLNDICWGLASIVYVAVYGRMGSQAVAAVQIGNTVNNLFMIVIFGLSAAASVMIGNSIGAGQVELSKEYARKSIILSVLAGVTLGASLAVASPFIIRLFNISAAVAYSTQIILYMMAAILAVRMVCIILITGVLRGGGDARQALIIEGFTMWFIGVPLTLLGAFVFRFPIHLVYAMAMIEEIVKCILASIRVRSGRWMRDVTQSVQS